MVTKQKHFLDSLRQMVSKTESKTCPICQKVYEADLCPDCQSGSPDIAEDKSNEIGTAYLVDLVSNHKIKIPKPLCKVGRDEVNDIVVSGDQSISRQHLLLINENNQYYLEDLNSRHGTFLNGSQVKTRESINDGDVVKIGVSLFWFVIEAGEVNNEPGALGDSSSANMNHFGQAHVTVSPEVQTEPLDPSTSTMNEIPVMPNEQSLLERLRNKTRSFDQSGLFVHAQAQRGTIAAQADAEASTSPNDTQAILPALDELSTKDQGTGALSSPTTESQESFATPLSNPSQSIQQESMSSAAKGSAPSMVSDNAVSYDQLMRVDLSELTEKYNDLKNKIEETQKQMEKIARQLNSMKLLGTELISGNDRAFVEACNKIFTELGWQTIVNPQDAQELQLRLNGQLVIARVMCTAEEPERAHLGQLSIAQTHFWCEQGHEPKGLLVVRRLSDKNNKNGTAVVELANYAAKKNVCMLTNWQLLALYRDLIIKNADVVTLREQIINNSGWLPGFVLQKTD